MQEQKEQSDETIGAKCTIQIRPMTRKNRKYEYRFAKLEDEKFSELNKNDYVYVLTPSEYSQLMDQHNNVTENDAANNDAEINSLKQKVNELEHQLKQTNENTIAIDKHNAMIKSKQDKIENLTTSNDETIKEYNARIDKLKKENTAENDSLKQKIDELKQQLKETNENTITIDAHNEVLQSKQDELDSLITSNNEKDKKITDYDKRINALGKENDELNSKLDNSVDATEFEDLKKDLDETTAKLDYWKKAFNEISEHEMATLDEVESLRKSNKDINKTNKLLNANINSLNATFDETKQQMQSDFQKQEKELKETIKKQQAHIDELTDKYQSLLPLKEYMPQKQHYKELKEIKDELTETKIELESTKSSIETKLATQKNELEKEHDIEINKLKDKLRDAEKEHTDEKAHLLVAYNTKYNELANKYNSLLSDARSLTRTNTLINGKHKQIIKDKEPIEIELTPSEQLSSDEPILYVPKYEKQE